MKSRLGVPATKKKEQNDTQSQPQKDLEQEIRGKVGIP